MKLRRMIIKILIRGLKSKIYYFDKYIVFIFFMKNILFDKTYAFVKITREIYIINNFKTRIFIEANIFILKRIIIDFATQFIKINNYQNIIISINSRARSEFIKRIMKLFNKMILLFYITILILIIYAKMLLNNRDLLFEL